MPTNKTSHHHHHHHHHLQQQLQLQQQQQPQQQEDQCLSAPVAPRSTYLHSEDAVILRVHLRRRVLEDPGNEDGAVERYVFLPWKHGTMNQKEAGK